MESEVISKRKTLPVLLFAFLCAVWTAGCRHTGLRGVVDENGEPLDDVTLRASY